MNLLRSFTIPPSPQGRKGLPSSEDPEIRFLRILVSFDKDVGIVERGKGLLSQQEHLFKEAIVGLFASLICSGDSPDLVKGEAGRRLFK
jgi:hypothetical protein